MFAILDHIYIHDNLDHDAILQNNYDDLYDALTGGEIGSAMLETFAKEPADPNDKLLKMDNVTLTPHIAGASVSTVGYAAELLAEDVRRFLAKEPPVYKCT